MIPRTDWRIKQLVLLRINDIVVGVITGFIVAIVAALSEGAILALRVLSLGSSGGGAGSKIIPIAIIGAVVGGIVGWALSLIFKPRMHKAQ